MHFRTHVKKEHTGISGNSGDEYSDGMVEHDMHVGELLKLIDDLGLANNTIVQYSTDNGPHYNTWPDAGTTPFRGEKNSNWEGAYRVPASSAGPAISLPARRSTASSRTRTGCRPSPPPPARPTSRRSCSRASTLNGRTYKNHIDGYNLLDYLSGKTKESPRNEFIYTQRRRRRRAPFASVTGRRLSGEPRRAAAGVARAVRHLRCRCCSTCVAIRSRSHSTIPTPITTG
jgi:hypothetical protein